MRIAVFEIEDRERKAFEDLRDAHDVQFAEGPLNAENAGRFEDCEIVSVFIYCDLDDAALRQLDGLKRISTRSTGYDHSDLQVCKDKLPCATFRNKGKTRWQSTSSASC